MIFTSTLSDETRESPFDYCNFLENNKIRQDLFK